VQFSVSTIKHPPASSLFLFMFLLFADSSAFWHDQCHNPHAHQYAELYEQHAELYEQHLPSTLHELARGLTVRASQNLPNAWARAFGALRDTCIWSYTIRCPDDVPVLVLGRVSRRSRARAQVAQAHAFRCIRAAALARWLAPCALS
jgi:hypothetical protein